MTKEDDKIKELAQEVLAWWEEEKCEGFELAISFKKKKPHHVILAEQVLASINREAIIENSTT